MDQQELRRLESQCIQEQPAWCIAACPLHVDARSFIHHISLEKWDEAWKVLRRTMPFPGILGRICDVPCRERCKRSEAGDPIEIGALERYCVTLPAPRQRVQHLPQKAKKIAVIGAGLAGLTAAWDLAKKGYPVDIFDAGAYPGEYLQRQYPDFLSEEIITRELSVLEKINIGIYLDRPINDKDFMDHCRADFDAVFLSLETTDPAGWGLDIDPDGRPIDGWPINGRPIADAPWRSTNIEGIFAGGQSGSPVWDSAEGRWAATSIDRYLQNVSLTAGREKEGPYETRLYTNISNITPLPAVPLSGPDGVYNREEAISEASRCLQCECLECVKVCPYLEKYKGYPKRYAREIYNNESIVMGSRQSNKMINSCSLCGLCEVVCPEDFDMRDLCLQTRRSMVRRGKMPPSAHEFALLDMEFSQSDRFFLARTDPGKPHNSYVFFPGCQLAATRPDQTTKIYRYLRERQDGVGLMLGCCGAPAHWAGREELFAREIDRFRQAWTDIGRPEVIAGCSTCLLILKDNLPEISAISLWRILADTALPGLEFRPKTPPAIHDPCTAREDGETREAVRRILRQVGAGFEELELGRDKTECCGFGGLMQNANPELAREVITRRAAQSDTDYLAYCAMCRDNLAAVGKRVIYLLDLFFPPEEADPAVRPRVDWSARRENRARLKEHLLGEVWGEGFNPMKEHENIKLIMDPEVRGLLDRRRILIEDVQQVIHHAEHTGDRLFHPDTGHYIASFRPYNAVFWVEYTPGPAGFQVHNAYTHRMGVVGGGRL